LNDFDCCCREISEFKVGGCKIAKLFAKHFKVSIAIAVVILLRWIIVLLCKLMLFCFNVIFFAFQVAEQAKFLNKTVVHIAVGTPNRITQLLENGKQLYYLFRLITHVAVTQCS